jgi:hypothetical protein
LAGGPWRVITITRKGTAAPVQAAPVLLLLKPAILAELGFERSQAAETGRPGYDPRDLLKLYLYGYLNRIREGAKIGVRALSEGSIKAQIRLQPRRGRARHTW